MTIPCPCCTAATADGLLCWDLCSKYLRRDLEALPDLMRDLRGTYARQCVGRGGGAEVDGEYTGPLFWNKHASATFDSVVNTVGTIIRWLDHGDLDDIGRTMTTWCAWLLERIQRIRGHEDAAIIVRDIAGAVRKVRRAVDLPPERFYIGQCYICEAELYAKDEDDENVSCPKCLQVVKKDGIEPYTKEGFVPQFDAKGTREWMRDQVVKGKGLAEMATRAALLNVVSLMAQVEIRPGTFDSWVARGRLKVAGWDRNGWALYRTEEVLTLAREVPERRTAKKERASA